MGLAKSNGSSLRQTQKSVNDSFRDLQLSNIATRKADYEARKAELEKDIAQIIVTVTFQFIFKSKETYGDWQKDLWNFELADSMPRFTDYRQELNSFLNQPTKWMVGSPRKYMETEMVLDVWRFYGSKARRFVKSDKERGSVVKVLCNQLQVVARTYRNLPGLPSEVLQSDIRLVFYSWSMKAIRSRSLMMEEIKREQLSPDLRTETDRP